MSIRQMLLNAKSKRLIFNIFIKKNAAQYLEQRLHYLSSW